MRAERRPPCSSSLLRANLAAHASDRHARLANAHRVLRPARTLLQELRCEQSGEWLEQLFPLSSSRRELAELIEYYRYYQHSPTIAHPLFLQVMDTHHARVKAHYYRQVKRHLQIEEPPS